MSEERLSGLAILLIEKEMLGNLNVKIKLVILPFKKTKKNKF